MIRVEIYCQPTSISESTKFEITALEKKAKINIKLEEISDIDMIISNNIMSIPSLKINDKSPVEYNSFKNYNHFIYHVKMNILKQENFGNMTRILVPVDYSEASNNAVRYALEFAKSNDAIVQLIHAHHPSAQLLEGGLAVHADTEQKARQRFKSYVEELIAAQLLLHNQSILIDGVFTLGFAVDEILEVTNKKNVALVVMGTTGSSRTKKVFGSVSTAVTLRSKIPVLLVPNQNKIYQQKNISMAISEPRLDTQSFDQLKSLIPKADFKLQLVHLLAKNDNLNTADLVNIAQEKFPNSEISIKNADSENVVEGLETYIDQTETDLLIVTHRKRSFFDRLFTSSISSRMSMYSQIPLLVMHEK